MLIVMMCGAEKLSSCVLAMCETPHNTIINGNAMMLRVNDMYTDVRTCTSIDLYDSDVASLSLCSDGSIVQSICGLT